MATAQKSLHEFLTQHCEIKFIAAESENKERCYVLNTEDCLLFMAEEHVQEMRNAIDQTDEVMAEARKRGDYSGVIMSYNWDAPEPGMDSIKIPVKLVESLDEKRSMIILRNLQGIQKDIEDGKARKQGLQSLLGDAARVRSSTNLDGERIFLIHGTVSASDRRRYAERYAEHVATNVLFDLPKALNARLQTVVPKDSRGRFFIEGRDITARKIRFGADANIEMAITDEGAAVYSALAARETKIAEALGKLLRQAMTDPFGFALKYYMGKHAVIKIASAKDEK